MRVSDFGNRVHHLRGQLLLRGVLFRLASLPGHAVSTVYRPPHFRTEATEAVGLTRNTVLISQPPVTVLMLGLDNAGKTALTYTLRTNKLHIGCRTLAPRYEIFTVAGVHFGFVDLVGHWSRRRIWTDYYAGAGVLIFVIDAADHERFPEAADEL